MPAAETMYGLPLFDETIERGHDLGRIRPQSRATQPPQDLLAGRPPRAESENASYELFKHVECYVSIPATETWTVIRRSSRTSSGIST